MEWLTRPLLTIGTTHVSLVALARFLAGVILVILIARLGGRLVGGRLFAYTGDRGLDRGGRHGGPGERIGARGSPSSRATTSR